MVRDALESLVMNEEFRGTVAVLHGNRPFLPQEIIWKDFMVFAVLRDLVEGRHPAEIADIGSRLVFKGGTSLSKAYQMLDRFSEDIDIALLQTGDGLKSISNNATTKYLKDVETHFASAKYLSRVQRKSSDKAKQFKRSVQCSYPRPWDGDESFVPTQGVALSLKDEILLEMDFRSDPLPASKLSIGSYIGEFLREVNVDFYNSTPILHPFEVKVMNYERTMIEKTLAVLGAIPHFRNPLSKDKLKLGSVERHLYDIHKLRVKFTFEKKSIDDAMVELFKSAAKQSTEIYGIDLRIVETGLPDLAAYLEDLETVEFEQAFREAYATSSLYFGHLAKDSGKKIKEADEILTSVRNFVRELKSPFAQT